MPYHDGFIKKFSPLNRVLMACLFLVVLTLAVYGQVRHFEFINLDDPMYLTDNPHVKKGLNCQSIFWAFTTFSVGNWHPLTWLSHMLDVDLYGMNSGAHHLTNLQFHIANTLALFFAFMLMTGTFWRSAVVAALFALHPLHVESVAWVAERKDVLSTLFWMLTMLLYTWYVRGPSVLKYLAVLLCYSLGLMSKPMLVTVPIILLLLDYWPLERFQQEPQSENKDARPGKTFIFLIYEKIPFFILSAASSAVTLSAQQTGGAVSSLEAIPFSARVANALVSYAAYIKKLIWPAKLAVIYPYSHNLTLWQTTGACLFITFVSLMVFKARRRHPFLIFGWLWYLITLIPVIGLVQVGVQSMADRYTYVPLIGLFIIIAWGAQALLHNRRFQKTILTIAGVVLLPVLMTTTWIQASYWKDNATLFKRTLMVTEANFLAHNNLGVALEKQGKIEEAVRHYTETLKINPNFAKAHVNLGHILSKEGKLDEAIGHFLKALQIDPKNAPARSVLGAILESQGKLDEAARYYAEALKIDPEYTQVHVNLGNILVSQGKTEEAMGHYLKSLQIEPNKEANYNLGALLFKQGHTIEAVAYFKEALRIDPFFANAHNYLGAALAKHGQTTEAIFHFREALRIDPDNNDARNNLEKMLATQEKINEALSRLQQIIAQNPQDAVAYYELGQVYKSMGELSRAAAYYQKAISINPAFFDGLKSLAVVNAMEGKYDTAREYLDRCVALQPDQWESYYLIAGTYARQNRTEESVQWLKRAVAKGFRNLELLKADQNLEGIRHTTYYQSLMRNL